VEVAVTWPSQASARLAPNAKESRCDEAAALGIKVCAACRKSKVFSAFAKKGDRRESRCKACKNKNRRELYERRRCDRRSLSPLAVNVIRHEAVGRTKIFEAMLVDIAKQMMMECS
jgi:hypothetical protein